MAEYVPLTVRFTPELKAEIAEFARDTRRSINSAILWLLEDALGKVEAAR